jgi:hypothetical protein
MICKRKRIILPITVKWKEGPSLYCAISEEAKKEELVAFRMEAACLELSRRSGGSLKTV